MRASSKRPRVESSSGVTPPPPPPLGDSAVDAFVDSTAAANRPPSASNVSSIHSTLDTVLTVEAAHG